MMIVEMSYFWRLLYVGDELGQNSLLIKLPLQVCQWSLISCIFMILSKNQKLFDICFYVCLILGSAACLTPTVIIRTGPRYYRYYQFFLEHELPIYSVFYMMFVHRLRPTYKGLYCVIITIMIEIAVFIKSLRSLKQEIPRVYILFPIIKIHRQILEQRIPGIVDK